MTVTPRDGEPTVPPDVRWGGLREEILVLFACVAGAVLVVQAGGRLPYVGRHIHVVVALIFLFVPLWVIERRGEDVADSGFHMHDPWPGLATAALLMAIVSAPFVVGYEWWWEPVRPFSFGRLPGDFWNIAVSQFIVVALPEETLFRGYLQTRLERRFPSRSVCGIPVGWAIPLSSAAFALCHFAVIPAPQRLAVFFPSLLFGFLRHRTGSLVAPIVFHGACNVLGDTLYYGYMG